MARPCIRRRSDGIHEIVQRGRLKKAALALCAVGLGLGLVLAATVAFALSLAVGLPLMMVGGAYLALRHLRRRRPTGHMAGSSPPPPTQRGRLRAIEGGLRGTPVPRLSAFAPPQMGRGPARDAGA